MSRLGLSFSVIFLACSLVGCGQAPPSASPTPVNPSGVGSSTGDTSATAAPTSASEIVRKDAASLPIGDYLPPLDAGRIEIATPKDWQTMPRDADHVVRFYHGDRNGLPRIDVTVEERSQGATDLSEANLLDFVKAVTAEVESKKIALLEPVIPMVIGPNPCARYVSHLNLKIGGSTVLAERQTILLSHASRSYTITLLTRPSNLKSGRDAAYAVCASIKFLAAPPAEPTAAEPTTPEPATSTP